MTAAAPSEITGLLINWSKGDPTALERLLPLVERDLRRLAHAYMRRENPDHTLQTTGLVNAGLSKTRRPKQDSVAKPRSLLRNCGHDHAPHPA